MKNITLYNRPSDLMTNWEKSLADLFDGFWTSDFASSFNPKIELSEMEKDYKLRAEIPGMSKEDIHVEVKDGSLRMWGEKKSEKQEKGENCSYSERTYGSFERVFRLPTHADADKINAAYKNGVLELTIPKTEEAKPKQIDVKIE